MLSTMLILSVSRTCVMFEIHNGPCSPQSLWLSGRASELGIWRSEVWFLMGTQSVSFVPCLWQDEKYLFYVLIWSGEITFWSLICAIGFLFLQAINLYQYWLEQGYSRDCLKMAQQAFLFRGPFSSREAFFKRGALFEERGPRKVVNKKAFEHICIVLPVRRPRREKKFR